MGEKFPNSEAQDEVDHAAIGLEVLRGLGVENPEDLAGISLNYGGDCTGTLAEAISKHRSTVGEDAIETITDALQNKRDLVEAISQDRTFRRAIMRDETGEIVRSVNSEDVKKN